MFDGGASQFNGNGFMPSPGGQAGGGSAQKKSYDNKSQAVRAVTIKQICQALDQNQETVFIDGKEVTNVTLVGKVVGVSEDQLTFNLQLDDGTGRMAVKMYANADDSDVERQNRSELREGIYVRVFGHIGSMHTERHISAFSARPIADHNEVTYHLSQVIFQHLHLTKGGDAAGAPPAAAAGGFPAAPGYGAAPAAMAAMPAAGGANGLNPIQADVLAAFSAPDAAAIEVGLSVDDVAARTGGRFNKQQIMAAVTYLQEDGQLYSTVDDAHWKACC